MSEIGNRLELFINNLNLSIRQFEIKAGLSNGLIGNVIKKDAVLGVDKISKILYTFPTLSLSWLITGKGPMLFNPDSVGKNSIRKKESGVLCVSDVNVSYNSGIPYYDNLPASAGDFLAFLNEAKPSAFITLPQVSDCTAIFPVYGSSMKGVIEPGDLIAIKEMLTRNEFDPSMPYLVITEEHRMVKYLHVDEKDDSIVWAESTNLPKIRLSAESIKKVYSIKCVIRFF
jgi:hypothetical protein